MHTQRRQRETDAAPSRLPIPGRFPPSGDRETVSTSFCSNGSQPKGGRGFVTTTRRPGTPAQGLVDETTSTGKVR